MIKAGGNTPEISEKGGRDMATKEIYEAPLFLEMGEFRTATGFLMLGSTDHFGGAIV